MASKAVLLALLACFVALSTAATFDINPASPRFVTVGVWSEWIFVSTNSAPTAPFTLSVTADVAGSVDLSTTTLNFDSVRRTASFRFRALTTDSLITISFTTAGDGAVDFVPPSTYYIYPSLREINVDAPSTNNGVQLPSEPKKITLGYPSTGDITLTPTATPPIITFTPSTIVIPAGASSASYVYMVTEENNVNVLIEFAVSGAESAYYPALALSSTVNIRGIKRSLTSPSYSGNVLVGGQSGQLFMYVTDYVNQSFTIAPQAADTVFTPSTLDFSAGRQQTVNFTFFTSSPSSNKQIYYKISGSGSNQYAEPSGTQINVPKGVVSVIAPASGYFQGKVTKLSLRVSSPLITDLTVKLFAANVQFNPAQVTFTATSGTSLEVGITPMAYGPDAISFALSGTAVDWYDTPATLNINVVRGTFIGPANWYLPDLIVGRQSDPFPVRVTVAPGTSVTLIPTSADLVFTPAQLVFTPDNVQQYLTVKPSLAQSDSTLDSVVSTSISFIVTGEDATLYDRPASVSGVTIQRRNIQVVLSKHVFYPGSPTTPTLYLGKRYTLWASASYVDEPVTITPVNPYMTFEPAQLQFSSGTTRISFVATVNSALPSGSSAITYIISGQAGGHYTTIAPTAFFPRVRPLYFQSAMIAPDDRVVGVEVKDPSTADLASNHIWSVVVRSQALPEGTLTITPRAYHVKFTPASADMKAEGAQITTWDQKKYIGAKEFSMPNQEIHVNFTMEALSSGVHEVWFELGGSDGAFYAAPAHTKFSFFIEERASAELPSKISAAPQVIANAVLFVFVAIIAVLVL